MIDAETRAVILQRIADGESLRAICDSEGMPARSKVHLLITQDEAFGDQYARAKAAQMEHYAEEILEISDDGSNDWMRNKQGDKTLDAEHVQRSRLRVDSRKWLMSKLAPKKYGEKVQIGGDPEQPLQFENVTNLDRAKALASLVNKAKEVA